MERQNTMKDMRINGHIYRTIAIARAFQSALRRNDESVTESTRAEVFRAIVEMVFNPQTDMDRSRVMALTADVDCGLWNPDNDAQLRITVFENYYNDAKMRRLAEKDGEPLYLRMKGRADRIARAYQVEFGETALGLRDIWYQFDWFDEHTIGDAIRFAMEYNDETGAEVVK